MVEFGLNVPRCNLLARMGMGKSSPVLAVIDTRMLAGEVNKTLLLAPLRVARSTWPDESSKWSQFQHLRVGFLEHWTPEEETYLRALTVAWKAEAKEDKATARDAHRVAAQLQPAARDSRLAIIDRLDIQTVNYEVAPQFVAILQGSRPFQMGVADEATKLKSFRLLQGGRRAQAISQVAHEMPFWMNLSGGIVPNGLANLWGPMHFIDKGARLGRTYDAFESRWFGYQRASDAVNAHKTRITRIAFPHAQTEILERIKDVSLALNPKDWFDIKDPIVERVYVDLPPEARKKYREMERDMFTHIAGHDIEAFASSGKVIKCIAEGTEVLTDAGWLPIESVTSVHKVWDGEEWVSTLGSVCNGYTSVVECWGVQMTPDHRVMTAFGWREAQEILSAQPIKRHDRPSVRLPDRDSQGRVCAAIVGEECESNVVVPLRVRRGGRSYWGVVENELPRSQEVLRLPSGRDAGRSVGHARDDGAPRLERVERSEGPLHEPQEQGLAQLRRPRYSDLHKVALFVREVLGRHVSGLGPWFDPRPERRERELHAEELSMGDFRSTGQQHPVQHSDQDSERRDDCRSGSARVRGEEDHPLQAPGARLESQGRSRSARVYDIVNAGPRHRFVVRGSAGSLLVHNCLQLANGAVYTGSEEQVERDISHWVPAHDEKLDALESIISENDGEVILVAYHFKPDLARLKKRFPQGRHIDTKKDEDAFKRGEIPLAFVHPQSIGHGVDGFQNVCHIIVFFAITFDLDPHDQVVERIGPMRQMQAGFDREVMVYLILARGTVDEIVDERLVKKRAVQDATMDSLAYKPEPALW